MILLGGGEEEERRCIGGSTGWLLIIQLSMVTVNGCLLSS